MNALTPWQQRIYSQATEALDSGRMGHAMLICGPAMLGKRAVAESLAKRMLCREASVDRRPCGECRSCDLFSSRSQKDPLELRPDKSLAQPDGHPANPDVVFVGYAWRFTPSPPKQMTEISVKQIRAISERLAKTPQFGNTLIALIEPADAMNEAACNALLKTLEEPVEGRYLWLVTSNPSRLPATIRSRCQRLEFHIPPRDEAQAWLLQQGHDAVAVGDALDAARGHPGLADVWLRDGGLDLRREVGSDLGKLARGQIAVIDTARRWTADDDAQLRLRHAADLVLAKARSLTDPPRTRKLAAWFDAANRTRELLRTTVRADLAVAELLLAWRDQYAGGSDATEAHHHQSGGRQ